MATYRVELNRDESGAWIATVRDAPGAHTYGRSIRQARARVRAALALWVDDVADAQLDVRIHLPRSIRALVRQATLARTRAAEAQEVAGQALADAAKGLVRDFGVSLRDAGELLGISHQRMQQILARQEDLAASTPDPGAKLVS